MSAEQPVPFMNRPDAIMVSQTILDCLLAFERDSDLKAERPELHERLAQRYLSMADLRAVFASELDVRAAFTTKDIDRYTLENRRILWDSLAGVLGPDTGRRYTQIEYETGVAMAVKVSCEREAYMPTHVPPDEPEPPGESEPVPAEPKEKPFKSGREPSGREMKLPEVEPWHTAVDGAAVLDAIVAAIRRHLVADAASIEAMALWVALSYLHDSISVSPILALVSPTKRCGKSTALDIVSRLVNRPMPTASITAAALFRSVEKWQPCLLIDEADTMFRQNDEIRTIVNSGFTRLAAVAVRCNGDNQEPRMYSVWGPKAIAKIGKLPDTIADRAIIVPLRRKAESEQAEPLRADRQNDFPLLASKLARWTLEHHERIAAQEPAIPPGLNDRQSDAWRELLRIANEAGSHWPDTARAAAVSICTRSSADDDGDIKTELLRDIRDFLAEHRAEHVSARDIVEHLVSLEGHSWPEYRDGKPITASSMTRLLKGFGIENMKKRPTTGAAPVSCFAVADFAEVFSRYLPPVPVPVQASAISGTLEQNHGNSLF